MLTRRFAKMPDEELRDAIAEGRVLAVSSEAARERLGALAVEAARRLVDSASARRAARVAYWQGVGRRAFAVAWCLHVLVAAFLLLVAAGEVQWSLLLRGEFTDEDVGLAPTRPWGIRAAAGPRYGRAVEPLALAVMVIVGFTVVRWTFTGRWRFGPRL
jgi:hypothetical protein